MLLRMSVLLVCSLLSAGQLSAAVIEIQGNVAFNFSGTQCHEVVGDASSGNYRANLYVVVPRGSRDGQHIVAQRVLLRVSFDGTNKFGDDDGANDLVEFAIDDKKVMSTADARLLGKVLKQDNGLSATAVLYNTEGKDSGDQVMFSLQLKQFPKHVIVTGSRYSRDCLITWFGVLKDRARRYTKKL